MEQVWPHKKSLIFGEKMLRFLEFLGGKNSSPIFSKPVWARAFNLSILLVGNIKPCNLHYKHFLLRPPPCNILAVPVLLWGFRLAVRHCIVLLLLLSVAPIPVMKPKPHSKFAPLLQKFLPSSLFWGYFDRPPLSKLGCDPPGLVHQIPADIIVCFNVAWPRGVKLHFQGQAKQTQLWMEQKDFPFFQSGFLQIYLEPPFPIGLEQLIYFLARTSLHIGKKHLDLSWTKYLTVFKVRLNKPISH